MRRVCSEMNECECEHAGGATSAPLVDATGCDAMTIAESGAARIRRRRSGIEKRVTIVEARGHWRHVAKKEPQTPPTVRQNQKMLRAALS
jgi:hypothetical protein